MEIISFRIKNYKGIVDTTVSLGAGKGSVYTLVGLNESGKTTILEAINSFRPDLDGVHAIAQEGIDSSHKEKLVPKKNKANFNGEIEVKAEIIISDDDVSKIVEHFSSLDSGSFRIEPDSIPRKCHLSRRWSYENSDYKSARNVWQGFTPKAKISPARKFTTLSFSSREWQQIVAFTALLLPKIVYFPTFLFDFPDRVLISEGKPSENERSNPYFKSMLEEAVSSINKGFDLKTHVVDRVLNHESKKTFAKWFPSFLQSDANAQVKATLSELTRSITHEVFDRWEAVLGSNISGKKLKLEPIIEEGEGNTRDVYLKFEIEDGNEVYKVSERSLGFRWFFSFLLFTKYFKGNVNGESIFLFDEPAANLHSMAQNKLLDSLEDIAGIKNIIIYTTHSHHMINPLWLENTFIISNGSPTEVGDVVNIEYDDGNADIRAKKYKTFVGQNLNRQHYFQPILDKLQIRPVPLEIREGGVLVEGKSDFYILNWYKKHYAPDLGINFIPVESSGNASALISLYLGTAQDFLVLLDSDAAGDKEKLSYLRKLPVNEMQIVQIGDILIGKKEIEDLVSDDLLRQISGIYSSNKKNTKKLISSAFSEDLVGDPDLNVDEATLKDLKLLIEALKKRLQDISG
ncbi:MULTISPECIES: AAA family ATPase [unclassified Sulfitobacter]|uniref:AAA family ATPase n=1 Tax=unclassified Sulfitobacter TaxID=196795 RepID=UPI00374768C9